MSKPIRLNDFVERENNKRARIEREREEQEKSAAASANEWIQYVTETRLAPSVVLNLSREPNLRLATLLKEIHHSDYEYGDHNFRILHVDHAGQQMHTAYVDRFPLDQFRWVCTRSAYLPGGTIHNTGSGSAFAVYDTEDDTRLAAQAACADLLVKEHLVQELRAERPTCPGVDAFIHTKAYLNKAMRQRLATMEEYFAATGMPLEEADNDNTSAAVFDEAGFVTTAAWKLDEEKKNLLDKAYQSAQAHTREIFGLKKEESPFIIKEKYNTISSAIFNQRGSPTNSSLSGGGRKTIMIDVV